MRPNLLWLLTTMLLITGSAGAQQPGKVFRIGILDSSTAAGSTVLWEAFRQELSRLGWNDGKNVSIVYRFAEQRDDRLVQLATELVGLKIDLLLAPDTPPSLALKKATTTIPIVMTNPGDPVSAGLVTSLAHPGGNVTGLSSLSPELGTKRLEILKDVLPKLTRVGVLRPSPLPSGPPSQWNELRNAASSLNLQLEEIQTKLDSASLDSAFKAAKEKQVDAMMTPASRALFAERKGLVEFAGKYRLPAIYFQREFVDGGGLMSYGVDYADLYRRAAGYVDKILKGAKPGDLPVQQATKFEFIINLKAAKQINLTIPVRVLERANQVIR